MRVRNRIIQAASVIVLGLFAAFADAQEEEENQIGGCNWCHTTCNYAWGIHCFVASCPAGEGGPTCDPGLCIGTSGQEYDHRAQCNP